MTTTALPYDAIPLVKGLPFVGNLLKFLRDPLENARSLEVHGNVVRSRTFFETVTRSSPPPQKTRMEVMVLVAHCC